MAYNIIMPKAGMAMETGKVVKWLKSVGDKVEAGEPLLEIETDKVSMEVEAADTGVLLNIIAGEGDVVPVTQTIGYIGNPGEAVPDAIKAQPEASAENVQQAAESAKPVLQNSGAKVAATPAARRIAKEKGILLDKVQPSGSLGQIKAADVEKAEAKSTPLAKAMAAGMGVDIASVAGSGYNGKVTKADIISAVKPAGAVAFAGVDELVPHSAMRKVIAKRMLQSHLDIPPVTQNCIADVTELTALREKINNKLKDTRVSLNDLIILAIAKTLREQPLINSSYTEEGLLVKKHINIGVAVALPEGLIVPVIKDADMLSLTEISKSAKALSAKAKEGRLLPDEYSGGTFTISNLGMMGVTSFTPIINQPENAILGVCAVQQQLEMDDEGHIEKRLKMGLSLTYDHRAIDGAQAACFSNRIVELLEEPLSMLV